MWFRNLTILRLASFNLSADALAACLEKRAFSPCTSLEAERCGWAAPRDGGPLVHAVGGQYLLALKTEKKLLPASVVRDAVKARAAEIEERQGFKPGRKQMKELKDMMLEELLPRAFNINTLTHVWISPAAGWLVIDASNETKRNAVMGELFRAVDPLHVTNLYVHTSPVAAMTSWLFTDEAPAGFTVDQDVELQSQAESKATVRYARHPVDVSDMARHISAGKRCTRLAMTWNDRVSLMLTDSLVLKSIKALDVIKESAADGTTKDEDERFDADFLLMAGELSAMLADLIAALGGERSAEECGDLIERAEASAAAESSGEPDPLYDQALTVVLTNRRASISLVQRHLRIGYNRAARLLEQMEGRGAVSAMGNDGSRKVLEGVPA